MGAAPRCQRHAAAALAAAAAAAVVVAAAAAVSVVTAAAAENQKNQDDAATAVVTEEIHLFPSFRLHYILLRKGRSVTLQKQKMYAGILARLSQAIISGGTEKLSVR